MDFEQHGFWAMSIRLLSMVSLDLWGLLFSTDDSAVRVLSRQGTKGSDNSTCACFVRPPILLNLFSMFILAVARFLSPNIGLFLA